MQVYPLQVYKSILTYQCITDRKKHFRISFLVNDPFSYESQRIGAQLSILKSLLHSLYHCKMNMSTTFQTNE